MASRFKVNDILWAKIKNRPWWPALITEELQKDKLYSVLFIGESAQCELSEEYLKPFEENLNAFRKTRNIKVLNAILAAQKLRAGEGSIDDEWAKAEALQQVENDKKVLHEYLKNRNVDPKNTDKRLTVNSKDRDNQTSDEARITDDQVIKKVKKAFETSDHSFSELDFPNHSDQKITLNLEFFNKICMTAGAHVEKLDDNKLVITSDIKSEGSTVSGRDEKAAKEISSLLIGENENKLQLYLANFIMKLQNSKGLIGENDPDLLKLEKLILCFDLNVLDSTSLIRSNFVKMIQALEIAMEKNKKKLTLLQKEFTLGKISAFLRKAKEKILLEALDCTQFLNAFKVFDSLESNQIFQNLIHSNEVDSRNTTHKNGKMADSNKAIPTISLISDDSADEDE